MRPQFDFVFDYYKDQAYKFEMGLDMRGTFRIFPDNQPLSLVKWYIPCIINNSAEAAPNCDEIAVNENLPGQVRHYPNPTQDNVTVSIPFELLNTEYTLFDSTGRIILKDLFKATQQTIDLSNCDNGIYFIRMNSEAYPIKIVKQ
jgi:hypothetical protein